MLYRFLNDHPDVLKVGLLNILSFSISFTNIEAGLKILALTLTISYGVWKWYVEYKKEKNGK